MDAKHQFKYSYEGSCEDFSPVDITFDVPGDASLNQMLYNFQSYLKACGFVFDGELEIVDRTFDVMDELDGTLYEIDKQEEFAKQWDKACGCPVGSKGIEGERGLDSTSSPLEDSKWNKAERAVEDFNKALAKLDNEQKQKCREEALKMSGHHYEATKEVKKNNWVHGICNPPSPDWKATNKEGYDGAASVNPKLYSEWLNKNK